MGEKVITGTLESRRLRTWILNLYIEPLRNSTNQLYYSKGYRTIEIVVVLRNGILKERI
jgi:hypothetical protein